MITFITLIASLATFDIHASASIESGSDLIRFENRSACAVDSKHPSKTAFLIVDSYNAGKILDSWIQSKEDTENMTIENGMKSFRLSLSRIWMGVMGELLAQRLPLLNGDAFNAVMQSCGNQFPCAEMDRFLTSVFNNWKTFFKENDDSEQPMGSCNYLKRFSDLQSNLNHDRPDQELLQKIALASLAKKDLVRDCFDESDELSSRRFILQLGVHDFSDRKWKNMGFEFWYSLKIYFSFAWRHPEFFINKPNPLTLLFRSLAIEQMIHLVSAECGSIEKPECSRSQVSLDIFRSLAKTGEAAEVDKLIPDRPEQNLLHSNLPMNREAGTIFPENLDIEQWLKDFQQRIIMRRGMMKQKLIQSISSFEKLISMAGAEKIAIGLERLKRQMNSDDLQTRKLKVLCSEIDISARPGMNVLEQKFKTIPSSVKFNSLVDSMTDLQLQDIMDYYRTISEMTFHFCEKISTEKKWNPDGRIEVSDFSDWFLELTEKSEKRSTVFAGMGAMFNRNSNAQKPFLVLDYFAKDGSKNTETVCYDEGDCVRLILKAMVDLYSVSAWSEALIPVHDWIQSPNLANPWSSANACKTYDPWSATKQALFGLVTDLGMTLTTGNIPIPAFLSIQTKSRGVTGFTVEPKGNEMILKPVKKVPIADVTFGTDLSSLIGVPCSLVITPTSNHPSFGGYYTVSSIRAESCTSMNNSRLVLDENSPWGENQMRSFSGCALCHLNPYSLVSGVSTIASYSFPALKIAVGALFTGISFAKRISDKIDIPHRYEVDPELVLDTYLKFGFIPKHCVKRLSRGRSCRHPFLTRNEKDTVTDEN
jgi:hypothetical protein